MAPVSCVGSRFLKCGVVGEEILAFLAFACVAVGVGIQHIAPYAQLFRIADAEVHAESLRVVDALVAPEAAESVSVSVGEAEVVGVIGRTEECDLVLVPEPVDVECGLVAVVSAVTGFNGAEPSVFHSFLYG